MITTRKLPKFRLDQTIRQRQLLANKPVFKDGTAFILEHGSSGWSDVVWEFIRDGGKFRCVGVGRADQPQYRGLEFPYGESNFIQTCL